MRYQAALHPDTRQMDPPGSPRRACVCLEQPSGWDTMFVHDSDVERCGRSTMVVPQSSKLITRVRFSSPAPRPRSPQDPRDSEGQPASTAGWVISRTPTEGSSPTASKLCSTSEIQHTDSPAETPRCVPSGPTSAVPLTPVSRSVTPAPCGGDK